jgi:hypothetical protein
MQEKRPKKISSETWKGWKNKKKRTRLKHKVIPNTSVEKNKCLGM